LIREWGAAAIPPTPAAAEALAALIEDMQVPANENPLKPGQYAGADTLYEWKVDGNLVWCTPGTPLTKDMRAAGEALIALAEDMQVQVIAEWEGQIFPFRVRETDAGTVVEFKSSSGAWTLLPENTDPFRAGYEAGKAGR
jgi:hypothetical protein